jgi:hypothetical protein
MLHFSISSIQNEQIFGIKYFAFNFNHKIICAIYNPKRFDGFRNYMVDK